jgi:hypothetical protein
MKWEFVLGFVLGFNFTMALTAYFDGRRMRRQLREKGLIR